MMLSLEQRRYAIAMCAEAVLTGCAPWQAVWIVALACHESAWGTRSPAGSFNHIGYEWFPGFSWSGNWVDATEGGTGTRKRYRKFRDFREMFEKLLYLIEVSKNHRQARIASSEEPGPEAKRRVWMLEFSKSYCPVDAGHGPSVARIYKAILEEARRIVNEEMEV